MTRRCSHCSNNGHNSRTCPTKTGLPAVGNGTGTTKTDVGGGLRIFGVRLTEGGGSMIMKKSASMGCISHYSMMTTTPTSSQNQFDSPSSDPMEGDNDNDVDEYTSDDPNHVSCSLNRRGERKKGIPWTEEEHRRFLIGLQKLGKGDWRGIARNYVVSRTPTQVASHAQKYFIRQSNASRRKRRSSLFDMVPDMVPATEEAYYGSLPESQSTNSLTSLDHSQERESIHSEIVIEQSPMELQENGSFASLPPLAPAFYPYIPVPYPYWSPNVSMPVDDEIACKTHVVLRPTPILPKNNSHVDELARMSNLSIKENSINNRLEPSELSSKLLSPSSSRQSAFHANPAVARANLDQAMNTVGNSFSSIFQEIQLPQQKKLSAVDRSSNQLLFPRVFVPSIDIDFQGFISEVKSNKALLEKYLLSCGAILLRGFPVSTASNFNDVVEALGFKEFPYIGGAASRTHITGRIFTANEAPPENIITFHHEMSNLPEYPSKLYFFCETEPANGGETPIVFSNHIYQQILKKHPDFVLKLEELGLTYKRFLGNEDDDSKPVGRSWKSSFMTDDKSIAEERAAKMCMKLEWMEDGVNTITGPLPAFKVDGNTGNKTWFNAMFTAHAWKDSANGIAYGNGTPLPSSIVDDCHKLCHQECVAIPWERGDVLLLDNLAVLHSRRSFQPPRRILASLAI